MKITIVEFDDELRDCIQFLFEEHQATCYKTISQLGRNVFEADCLIIDLDHEFELTGKFIKQLRSQFPQKLLIGTSTKNDLDSTQFPLFHHIIIKPHIALLFDIIQK